MSVEARETEERGRSEIDGASAATGLSWRGGGRTAIFAAARGETDASPTIRWFERTGPRPPRPGSGGASSQLEAAVRRFFDEGGKRVAVLADTGGGPDPDHPELTSIGNPDEFGFGSGVYALAEDECIGTIVIVDRLGPAALASLESLARERSDLVFLLESAADPEPAFHAASIVRVHDAAAVAGRLEATEYPAGGSFVPGPGWARLRKLRVLQGVRRSIDWGTRWLLGELHHLSSWRRAERAVRAFLYRLDEEGVLERGAPFEVRCAPCPPTRDERRRGRPLAAVRFEVVMSLRDPAGR